MLQRELDEKELEELKKIEVNMLNSIHTTCEKMGIKYSLAAGTLLGAARHKNFIPWDDDIDIMMLREDYEKFLKKGSELLGGKFIIVTYKDYAGYGMPFAKVMKKDTKLVEINTRNSNAPNGIFIDIFPIDYAPQNFEKRKEIFKCIRKQKSLLLCRSNYIWDKGWVFDSLYRVKGVMLRILPKRYFINKIDKKIKESNQENSSCLISYCGDVSFDKSSYPIEWFAQYVDIEFGNYKFKVISGYKELLKLQYGNYMELPPKEKRLPHHVITEFKLY